MNKSNNSFIKSNKMILLLFTLFCIHSSFSQIIGVNTTNPLGIFHVDGKGDNTLEIATNQQQQLNDFIILENSSIGIGTIFPTSKLHIKAETDPVRIDGLPQSDVYNDHIMLIDNNNIVKKSPPMKELISPRPAFFRLEKDMRDFLRYATEQVSSQYIPFTLIKNAIDGLSHNVDKGTVTIPKGIYKIVFNYDASHPGCVLSSYYMEFPTELNDEQIIKIPALEEHFYSGEHGGTISFITILSKKTDWKLRFGRNTDGDCSEQNMTLKKHATQILITQISN